MADDITIPATGSGTATPVVATDDVSSRHFQRIKLDVGADGATDPVTLTRPLPTGLLQTRISQTPTVSTSPAYTAKDAVGGLLTFANAARVSGGTIVIQSVVVVDLSQQMPALDLVLFDRTFTAPTDNSPFDPTDAELANLFCPPIPITNWSDFNDNAAAGRFGLGCAGKLNGTDLFGVLVTRTVVTFVGTADIVVILTCLQD